MRAKKSKALRRLARVICQSIGKPNAIESEYKKMKQNYKAAKGEI